ncbi:unnamed protein product [Mytilus edulis]|uniref:Uncharacterized protein n=1 Tax=Mytilus edulis TaxID=6550 RepID=A0A8S3U3J5_MYTED|nr:unnamed protein product [Mytilus edulis]
MTEIDSAYSVSYICKNCGDVYLELYMYVQLWSSKLTKLCGLYLLSHNMENNYWKLWFLLHVWSLLERNCDSSLHRRYKQNECLSPASAVGRQTHQRFTEPSYTTEYTSWCTKVKVVINDTRTRAILRKRDQNMCECDKYVIQQMIEVIYTFSTKKKFCCCSC